MEFCSLHMISLDTTQGWEVNQTRRSRAKIRSIGNRMDSGFSNVPMVLELIWSIQSRPVRHSVNYSFPSICVSLPSFNSNKSQCPVPRLEQVGQDLSLSPTTVFSEVIEILRSFWGQGILITPYWPEAPWFLSCWRGIQIQFPSQKIYSCGKKLPKW